MRHVAVLALAGAIWLINRRRQSQTKEGLPVPLPPRIQPVIANSSIAAAPVPAQAAFPPATAASTTSSASKPILGAVLQWIFLILLGSALSLTAAKGAWDTFALLVTAAAVQLCGQLTRWYGGHGGGNGIGRRCGPRAARGSAAGRPAGGVGAGGADAVGPARRLRPDPRLAGVWVKDASQSDSMDEATAAMRLNGLVRTAIRLVRGLEVDGAALRAGRFDMAIFSVIAWFKVRESYLLDGTVGYYKRRDLRKGKHAASVAVQPDGSLVLSVSWGEPLAGTGTDHFALIPAAAAVAANPSAPPPPPTSATDAAEPEPADGDLLVVTSTIRLAPDGAGQPGPGASAAPTVVQYRTVYARGGRGRRQQQHHDHYHDQQQHDQPQLADH